MDNINKECYKLSIITVSYNAEKSIEKTIKSVIRNKNSAIEYIIVDGFSKDGTISIVDKYISHIDKIICENDDGMYDALNKGIRIARGKYVMLLAADDVLIDGMISKVLTNIKEDTDVWCGTLVYHNECGFFFEKSNPNLEELKYDCSLRNPAAVFLKQSFEKYGYYDTQYKCDGDRELFLRFYLSGAKFQIVDLPVVVFNEGGMSTSNKLKLAIPEGIAISKKYGFTGGSYDSYFKSLIFREHIKQKLITFPGYRLLNRLRFSDFIYPIICKIKGRQYNKLSEHQKALYGLDCCKS